MKKIAIILSLVLLSCLAFAQSNASLQGRTVLGTLPRPNIQPSNSGVVVVTIWVDQYGTVQKAVAGADGTTVTDKELWDVARKAALGAHFNMSADAPALQQGSITYHFSLGENPRKQVASEAAIPVELTPVSTPQPSVLKFLDIPIDGTKAQFSTKLRAKGFTYNSLSEGFKGQFNGKDVEVFIHTNHNLVDRVYVSFPSTNEAGIKTEYNRLLSQFKRNDKYMDFGMNEEIPENEDISYEISVNNNRYQSSFCYFDPERDLIAFMNDLVDELKEFYTQDQYAILKQAVKEYGELPEDERKELMDKLTNKMQELELNRGLAEDPERTLRFLTAFVSAYHTLADGQVWFMIHENYGRYNIGLYYDNLHNQAHGEDL